MTTTTVSSSPVLFTSNDVDVIDVDSDEGAALVRSFEPVESLAGYLPAHIEEPTVRSFQPEEMDGALQSAKVALQEQVGLAGLDFPVEVSPLFQDVGGDMMRLSLTTPTGRASPVNVVRRADTKFPFAVSRDVYRPFDVTHMGDALSPLVAEGLAAWDGCLNLRSGAVGVVRARLTMNLPGVPGDKLARQFYLCAVNSHDLTMVGHYMLTSVRPVCKNTLQMALWQSRKAGKDLRIKHCAKGEERIETAHTALRAATETARAYLEAAAMLAQYKVTDGAMRDFVENMLPSKGDKVSPQLITAREGVLTAYASQTSDGVRGTAYGAAEAFGEWSQHYRKAKSPTARMDSILFGRAADDSSRAYSYWMDQIDG